MKIEKTDLAQFARQLLSILRKEGIDSKDSLYFKINQTFEVDNDIMQQVSIQLRDSNLGTSALTLSYESKKSGVLIDIKFNNVLEYTKIIVKSQEQILGYTAFCYDEWGNIVQDRQTKRANFSWMKNSLEELAKLR